jgi:ribosomal protein L37AE/L43A
LPRGRPRLVREEADLPAITPGRGPKSCSYCGGKTFRLVKATIWHCTDCGYEPRVPAHRPRSAAGFAPS